MTLKGDVGFMLTKDERLKAVYSDDLVQFLTQLNLLEKFNSGDLCCRYCKNVITQDTLYAFVPVEADIEICCNRPQCVIALAEEAKK